MSFLTILSALLPKTALLYILRLDIPKKRRIFDFRQIQDAFVLRVTIIFDSKNL